MVFRIVNFWVKKYVLKVSFSDGEDNSDDNEDYSEIGVFKEYFLVCCERFRKVTESVEEFMRNNVKIRSYREIINVSGDRVFECLICYKLFIMRDIIKKYLIRYIGVLRINFKKRFMFY